MSVRRDSSIDIYRDALMLGICMLHSISQGGHNVAWAANSFEWCVTGFAFMSGWFGARFSILKIIRLYAISFYCAVTYCLFDVFVLAGYDVSLRRIFLMATGQWFLNAYVLMLCMVPVVNLACSYVDSMRGENRRDGIVVLLLPIIVAMCWSFSTTLPFFKNFIPRPVGLTAYSAFTLLSAYIVARVSRMEFDRGGTFMRVMQDWRVLVPLCGLFIIAAAIGLGDYNSPFSVLLSAGMLFLFKITYFPKWLAKVGSWLGPSMFSVYLLHSHGEAWGYLRRFEKLQVEHGIPIVGVYMLTALTVFAVCMIADIPRRFLGMGITRLRKRVCKFS